VLFVNVPVGALILAATPRLVPAYPAQLRARIDVAGASTITAGLTALVYSTSQVPERGWTAPLTLGTFLAAVVLLGAFLAIEAYHPVPLVPLSIFRHRSLVAADAVALLGGAAIIASPIFFLTLYLQQILGFSAIQAGLATLPLALSVFAGARLAPTLISRVGPRRLLAGGLALAGVSLLLLARIHIDGSYHVDVASPIMLLGLGMGLSFVPPTATATAGVAPSDQGLASGLLQTAQQLGVALDLAALTSLGADTIQSMRDGTPHITPVGMWSVDPDSGVVEVTGRNFAATKKFRDVARTGRAAIVIDDVLPPFRPRGVEIRGHAEAIGDPEPRIRIYPYGS
jgi:PPOX class F420-dependent enzyme/OxyR family protein